MTTGKMRISGCADLPLGKMGMLLRTLIRSLALPSARVNIRGRDWNALKVYGDFINVIFVV